MTDWRDARVLVTGAHGFLGGHVVEALRRRGLTGDALVTPTSAEADLREPENCERVVQGVDVVVHLAARVGGIALNDERPGELFHDTIRIGVLLLEAARRAGVRKVVMVGTTCSYPSDAPIPFREETLFDGPPDDVTGFYGFAKKALLVMGQAYRKQYGLDVVHLIPVNLYGPGDHFDPHTSHVVPALVRRFVEAVESGAREVGVWGTGNATREFLYVADAAEAIVLATERYGGAQPVNVGSGRETPIRDLVTIVADSAGFDGDVRWDRSKPDGQPRRCLDVTRARELFGFEATTPLEVGIRRTVEWYRANR